MQLFRSIKFDMWNFFYKYADKNTFCEPEFKNVSSGRNFEVMHYRQIELNETEF